MDATIGQGTERVTGADPVQRNEALADARRRASQAALQSADDSQSRKADQREAVRAILERAVGANTRVSVARSERALTFVYRAIDVDSGEIIKEWPPARFVEFLQENGADEGLARSALSGLVLDEKA